MEGETLYGANSSVVAGELALWGYWMFPDLIPGETPKQQLAKRMNEAELNRYYRQKGFAYIRDNWFADPRLILGKLVRGFVPVPRVPLTSSYPAFLARLLLYIAFFDSWRSGIQQNESFRLFPAALLRGDLDYDRGLLRYVSVHIPPGGLPDPLCRGVAGPAMAADRRA